MMCKTILFVPLLSPTTIYYPTRCMRQEYILYYYSYKKKKVRVKSKKHRHTRLSPFPGGFDLKCAYRKPLRDGVLL